MARLAIPPVGSNEQDFRAVVMAANLIWQADNIKPTAQHINRYCTSLSTAKIKYILESEEFTAAMIQAGIPWSDKIDALSPRQMMALQVMCNPLINKPIAARLKMAGVSNREWQVWKKNPIFREQWERLSFELILEHKGELIAEVVRQGLDGKLEAIKYANELSGQHTPAEQRIQDMQSFVQAVLEIIQTEVHDDDTLGRIGTRMMALMAPSPQATSPLRAILEGA